MTENDITRAMSWLRYVIRRLKAQHKDCSEAEHVVKLIKDLTGKK